MQALLSFLIAGILHDVEESYTHLYYEVIKTQKNQNPKAGQTSMARDGSVFRYDPDYLHEQFAGLVIQQALPFNHFDHEQTTRVFQNTMQPRYTHVSRSTLKRNAMRLWLVAKQEIIDSFGDLNTCVNLTTEVWSAPHGVPGFWKEKETMFPIRSRMAMDLISVQASSVASESVFSTSGRVLSMRRTKLTPASLKRNEAIPLSDEEIALDASSKGTLSLGGPWSCELVGLTFEYGKLNQPEAVFEKLLIKPLFEQSL
nr:putative AC transposase [Tanacetum cinerariifolium]